MLTDPAGRNSNDSSDSRNIFPSNIAFRSLDQLSLIHAWTSQDNLPSNGSSLLAKHHFPSCDYSSPFLVFPSSVEITMYGLKAVQPLEQYIRRSKATHRQHYLRRLNPKFHSVLVTRSLRPRSARSISTSTSSSQLRLKPSPSCLICSYSIRSSQKLVLYPCYDVSTAHLYPILRCTRIRRITPLYQLNLYSFP